MKKSYGLILGVVVIAVIAFFTWNTQQKETVPAEMPSTQMANDNDFVPQVDEKSFTMTEVALHNTETDCYSVVSGNVYELTSWVSKHPGGPEAIKGICGTDATAKFSGQHGGQPQPEQALSGFLIGKVAN